MPMSTAELPDPAAGRSRRDGRMAVSGRASMPFPHTSGALSATSSTRGSPPSTPAPPAEVLVAACDLRRSGYVVHRERGAPNWLFTWTRAGTGWFRQGGVELVARPGELVVAGPDVAHDYAVAHIGDDWLFWWVHCPVRTTWHQRLRPYEVGKRLYAVSGVPSGLHDRIEAAFRRLHADIRWADGDPPPEPVAGRTARPAVAWGTTARALAL